MATTMKSKSFTLFLLFCSTILFPFYLPWWIYIALFVFIGIFSSIKWGFPYWFIFLLGGAGWFLPALLFLFLNQGILVSRIAILLNINEPLFLPLLTGVIGGLLALSSFILGETLVNVTWIFIKKKKLKINQKNE